MANTCRTWEEPALGNIYVRKMYFLKAGDVMDGHCHNFDHTTMIFKGSVRVRYTKNGEQLERIVSAPKPGRGKPTERGEGYFIVPKDIEHEITALEDDTEAWCVFAHRGSHGEVVEDFSMNTGSYN